MPADQPEGEYSLHLLRLKRWRRVAKAALGLVRAAELASQVVRQMKQLLLRYPVSGLAAPGLPGGQEARQLRLKPEECLRAPPGRRRPSR